MIINLSTAISTLIEKERVAYRICNIGCFQRKLVMLGIFGLGPNRK